MTILKKSSLHPRITIILVFLMTVLFVNAQNPKIVVNGITYTILSLESKTVEVSAPENNMVYSGQIKIPANITFKNRTFQVKGVGDRAFRESRITNIVLSEGLEYLGCYAFYNSKLLRNISFPKSLKKIDDGCFYGCIFDNLTIPNTIVEIGSGTQYTGVRGLLKIEDGNTNLDDLSGQASTIYVGRSITSIGSSGLWTKHLIFSKNIRMVDVERCLYAYTNSEKELKEKSSWVHYNIIKGERMITLQHNSLLPMREFIKKEMEELFVNVKLRVPKHLLEEYRNHSVWGNFFEIEGF